MKKIIIFLFIVLCPIIMFAKEYEVSDINLKLEADDKYMVLTRTNLDNNEDLKKLNIAKEYMAELMNKSNIYYDIISNDISNEILVIVPDTTLSINNLTSANDNLLNDLKEELVKKTGAKVSDIYKAKYNYVIVDYFDDKSGYYIVNYYTIVNARGYNIQLQKKTEITEEDKEDLKKIIDSVEITVLDKYKEETEENQKKLDNYGKSSFDYMKFVYGAIIGCAAGLISYLIGYFIRKKKSS